MLDALVDDILADPLARARAAPGAIGYVGFDVPEDLLAATGRHALHLPWDADAPTPIADGWLERSFAPWAASILEQWAAGVFDFLPEVIFSRGDDSAQRLYYYVCELQRRGKLGGPEPLILDIARIGRSTSVARTIASVRALAERLALDEAALEHGIAIANRRRAFLAALADGRRGSGARFERIARAALFAPLEKREAGLQEASNAAAGFLLLAGTPPPDDRLHRGVEAVGWTIADEAHERGLGRLGPPIEPGGDAAAAIGTRLHQARFGPRSFADPAAELIAAARRARADAIVLWLIEQEESIVWHVPSQVAAAEQAGIPMLVLTRRRWDAADGAIDEIAAWLKELRP